VPWSVSGVMGKVDISCNDVVMWVKQCHKPPIWEWFIPPVKMVIWGMVYDCFAHILLNI
jgi:hypothetical protein